MNRNITLAVNINEKRGMIKMTINQTNLNDLTGKFNAIVNTFSSDFEENTTNYVNAQNSIWCSEASVSLAGEIKTCLDSALSAIDGTLSNIKSSVSNVISIQNTAEGHDLEFSFSYTLPTGATKCLLGVKKEFDNSDVGLLEGHTVGELKSNFNDITSVVTNCFTNLSTAVSGSPVFSNEQQSRFQSAIENEQLNFKNSCGKLLESWSERATGEDTVRSTAASEANTALDNINRK